MAPRADGFYLMAPTEMPWGQYTMLFADPAGHLVWLGANL